MQPQRHRATEKNGDEGEIIRTVYHEKDLTERIIASAIEVHRHLGPGLLESAYEECLCHEFNLRGISFERQKPLPLEYKGIHLDCGYRMDVVVNGSVVLELKCVDFITSVHHAQLLTYLKISKLRTGLIINFHSALLKDGIKRLAL